MAHKEAKRKKERVIFCFNDTNAGQLGQRCEQNIRGLARGARRQGSDLCRKECGVNPPIPLAKWLQRMTWVDGATFLREHAESLAGGVDLCVNQGWVEIVDADVAHTWLRDALHALHADLVTLDAPEAILAANLKTQLNRVATARDDFFAYAYRGILQDEVLDCAHRFSIELWREGARPDIVRRPGGAYYAFLHSLSVFFFTTKRTVTLEEVGQQVDLAYCKFDTTEKRLVFAFLLMREYVRRLKQFRGNVVGVFKKRRALILDFIRRATEES
jgi:hypothetical protein